MHNNNNNSRWKSSNPFNRKISSISEVRRPGVPPPGAVEGRNYLELTYSNSKKKGLELLQKTTTVSVNGNKFKLNVPVKKIDITEV